MVLLHTLIIIELRWLKQLLGTETPRFYPKEGHIIHLPWGQVKYVISLKRSKLPFHRSRDMLSFTVICIRCSYGLQSEGSRSYIYCHYYCHYYHYYHYHHFYHILSLLPLNAKRYMTRKENVILTLWRLQFFCKWRKASISSDLIVGGNSIFLWPLQEVFVCKQTFLWISDVRMKGGGQLKLHDQYIYNLLVCNLSYCFC